MSELQELSGLSFRAVEAALTFKLLGPSATYLGSKTRELTEKAATNIEKIFLKAIKLLGEQIEKQGEVPPRVLRGIMQEGAFCEDQIASDYLAGVLASSRTDGDRDDRGVVMNAIISRQSVYQLGTHYIAYHVIKNLYDGTQMDFDGLGRLCMARLPLFAFMAAMGFHEHEKNNIEKVAGIIEHSLFGLESDSLIGGFDFDIRDGSYVSFLPSARGTEFFLWAHGHGKLHSSSFYNPKITFELSSEVILASPSKPIVVESTGEILKKEVYGYAHMIGQSCPINAARNSPHGGVTASVTPPLA